MTLDPMLSGIWLSDKLTNFLIAKPHGTAADYLAWLLGPTNAQAWIPAMKSRGITQSILWDVSHEQSQQNGKNRSPFADIWFVGDCGALDPMFPASSVRAFVKIFNDAGISLGSCIRPGEIVRTWDNRPRRVQPDDWGVNLIDKIQRAKALGIGSCFYVDTNLLDFTRAPIPADLFLNIRDYFKTELIAFEITGPSLYGNPPTATSDYYGDARFFGYFKPTPGKPPPAKMPNTTPDSRYLIHPADDNGAWLEAQFSDFVAAVRGGARMIGRAAFPSDPLWTFVDRVYAAARAG